MGGSPKIEFTRSLKGYNPVEVDAILTELQKEIIDLKQRNDDLTDTVEQRDAQIKQLSQNAQRDQSNVWLTEILNKTAQVAQETEQTAQAKAREIENNAQQRAAQTERTAQTKADELMARARQEAELLRGNAQKDAETARQAMNRLSDNIRSIIAINEKAHTGVAARLSELSALLDKAALDFPASTVPPAGQTAPAQTPVFPDFSPLPTPGGAGTAPVSADPYAEYSQNMMSSGNTAPETPALEPDGFSYEDFIRQIQKEGRTPQYPPKRPRDEIIAVFGEDDDPPDQP